MQYEIVVPDLGAADPVLNIWLAGIGEHVFEGDRIVELLLEHATVGVSAPCTGRIVSQTAQPGDRLHTGQVLGHIEEEPA